ncbi:hypothetical protein NDU88_004739 [Pleurodeles waltl]|uniref:Uncharacterized protein n=1 Tax=Pleurodeles waltl TaxID=8319 RepID=A0AAV7UIZ8_PLEWA|nr:hypothetical protein NDU88_004739 [Pleurodeles waltl]
MTCCLLLDWTRLLNLVSDIIPSQAWSVTLFLGVVMVKDKKARTVQQTIIDQFVAHSSTGCQQAAIPDGLQAQQVPTGEQILVTIEATSTAVQVKIEALALDVSLLHTDVRKVMERTAATERQVGELQMEMKTLKAIVTEIEAQVR